MNVGKRIMAGVQAAKQLGADKRVAMWTPDSQVGMLILQPPPIPKIDHEVPLFPVEHLVEEEKERHKKEEEAPPIPKIDHEPWIESKHKDENLEEDDSR